jgi:hypothetical protein
MRIWRSIDSESKARIAIFQQGDCNSSHCWTGSAELVIDVISRLIRFSDCIAWLKDPNSICVCADFETQEVTFAAHAVNYSRTITFDQFLAIPLEELPNLARLDGVKSLAEYQPV